MLMRMSDHIQVESGRVGSRLGGPRCECACPLHHVIVRRGSIEGKLCNQDFVVVFDGEVDIDCQRAARCSHQHTATRAIINKSLSLTHSDLTYGDTK